MRLPADARVSSWLAVPIVAALALIGSASASLLLGLPIPSVHDEFSYLLAADTFARGRLTNPPHPMWRFFETFHVIQQPTYASKYPPAQGLLLAAGQVLGHPVAGLWLGSALMCGAITWMLRGWVPPRWALIGGLVALLLFGVVGHWAQDYFGGAVAAAGGALVYGALPRLARRPRAATSIALGLGVAILANSRPWEGLLICVPALAFVALRLAVTRGRARIRLVVAGLGPAAALLALAVLAMLRYNAAVTGDALLLPYLHHERTYAVHPLFLWQSPRPAPEYRHQRIADFHAGWELGRYEAQRDAAGYAAFLARKLGAMAWRFCGPVFMLPALAALVLWRRPLTGLAAAGIGMMILAAASTTFYASHYVAPMAGLVIYFIVMGLRTLTAWRGWRGRARMVRPWIVPALLALAAAAQAPAAVRQVREDRLGGDWGHRRQLVERDLRQQGGRHLVLVRYPDRYPEGWSIFAEWVYNSAAIDEQDVVWARDMGDVGNAPLLEHFAARRAWLLVLHAGGPRLVRLRDAGGS